MSAVDGLSVGDAGSGPCAGRLQQHRCRPRRRFAGGVHHRRDVPDVRACLGGGPFGVADEVLSWDRFGAGQQQVGVWERLEL